MASNMKTTSSLIMSDTRATQEELQYARGDTTPASGPSRRFVVLGGGLLVALLVPIFVSLGMWQWNKAAIKESRQSLLDARSQEPAIELAATPVDAESLRFRRVKVRGTYEPQYQILIDNRVHNEQAGFHVVTPLRISGSAAAPLYVLVNRGWIPGRPDHRQLPEVDTPAGDVAIVATAIVPGTRFFTLAAEPPGTAWQKVWQNLDLDRYRQTAPFALQPVVLQLDPDSPGGGFVRDWPRPDERIERHIGYAWQWFGFAAASVAIWLFFLLRPYFKRP